MSNPLLSALGVDYCGPYISDGRFQTSVEGYATARNALEQACKEHDGAYARGADRQAADRQFVRTVYSLHGARGLERVLGYVFGTAVSAQMLYRYLNGTNGVAPLGYLERSLMSTKSISSAGTKRSRVGYDEVVLSKPSVYGTGIVLQPPVVSRYGNGIKVRGSEFANPSASGTTASSSLWMLIMAINLNPAYFENSRLGNYCSLFQKFKFTKIRLNYITNVGTSTNGNILVEYAPSSTQVCRAWNGATFLNQVMGNAGSCLMPIWENFKIDIPLEETGFKYIDMETSAETRYVNNGCIYVYGGNMAAGTKGGYYVLEYEILFDTPITSPRINEVPFPSSWSFQYVPLAMNAAAAAGNLVELTHTAVLGGSFVYKVILDITNASASGGTGTVSTSFANNLKVAQPNALFGTVSAVVDGFTCFGLSNSTGNVLRLSLTQTGIIATGIDYLYYTNTIATTIVTIPAWILVQRTGTTGSIQADA